MAAASALGALGWVLALQPGGLEQGSWFWFVIAASAALAASAGCFIAAFVKLCTNVEFLVREAVDRRGG